MTAGLEHALALTGDRWTLQIVDELLRGPKRFGELGLALSGIAPNVLTARIRQLERDGIVVAIPYSQRPMRFAYSLSDSGRELADAISVLGAWGARRAGLDEAPVHQRCGSRLSVRLYCPTCEQPATDSEADDVHWV